MKALLQAIKHTVFGIHNIGKILLSTGNLVDKRMRDDILSGNVRYPRTVDKELCLGCGVCARVCPNECISMKKMEEPVEIRPGQKKEKYPELNVGTCCFCYQCHDNCPTFVVHGVDAAINPRGVRDTGIKAADLFERKAKKAAEQASATEQAMTVDADLCLGCGVCANVCPVKAIEMVPTGRKIEFPNGQVKEKIPKIDMDKCIKCMLCKNSCLTAKVHKKPAAIDPEGLEPSGIEASELFGGGEE